MFSLETRRKARDLFVEGSLSYEEVAKESGVSINNLKRWGSEGKWTQQRAEYQRLVESLRAKVAKAKVLNVDAILELLENPKTMDSQKVFGHTNILKALNSFQNGRADSAVDRPALFVEFLTGFSEYLKERDPDSLRYLQPHIRGFAEAMKGT